jgi:hypothetical protein
MQGGIVIETPDVARHIWDKCTLLHIHVVLLQSLDDVTNLSVIGREINRG